MPEHRHIFIVLSMYNFGLNQDFIYSGGPAQDVGVITSSFLSSLVFLEKDELMTLRPIPTVIKRHFVHFMYLLTQIKVWLKCLLSIA